MDKFEEMLEGCRRNRRPDETIVYVFGAGSKKPMLSQMKMMKKAYALAMEQDGYIGVCPLGMFKSMLIFDTLNHAKAAKNVLSNEDIPLGNNIVPMLIPTEDAKLYRG